METKPYLEGLKNMFLTTYMETRPREEPRFNMSVWDRITDEDMSGKLFVHAGTCSSVQMRRPLLGMSTFERILSLLEFR